jgi:hypothetical protein
LDDFILFNNPVSSVEVTIPPSEIGNILTMLSAQRLWEDKVVVVLYLEIILQNWDGQTEESHGKPNQDCR